MFEARHWRWLAIACSVDPPGESRQTGILQARSHGQFPHGTRRAEVGIGDHLCDGEDTPWFENLRAFVKERLGIGHFANHRGKEDHVKAFWWKGELLRVTVQDLYIGDLFRAQGLAEHRYHLRLQLQAGNAALAGDAAGQGQREVTWAWPNFQHAHAWSHARALYDLLGSTKQPAPKR